MAPLACSSKRGGGRGDLSCFARKFLQSFSPSKGDSRIPTPPSDCALLPSQVTTYTLRHIKFSPGRNGQFPQCPDRHSFPVSESPQQHSVVV